MKNIILGVVIFFIVIGIMTEFRYQFSVHSPIVAKMDRLTGDVWIANNGVWNKIASPAEVTANQTAQTTASSETPAKTK